MIDLDYGDPEPSALLLEQVRGRGRTIRRRRRMGVVAGGAAVAVMLATAVLHTGGGGDPRITAPPATQSSAPLPVAVGRGPAARSFTLHGHLVDEQGRGRHWAPPAGPVTKTAPARGHWQERFMWVSQDAMLVVGEATPGGDPEPSLSHPLTGLPAEGFWGNLSIGDGDGQGPGRDGEPGNYGRNRTIFAGLVRGPVTRVVISLPTGDVEAQLAPATVPRLGTFYWLAVDQPASVLATATHTAYRGDRAVFRCTGTACAGGATS